MNFGNVLILPPLKVHQLEDDVARKTADKTKYTNIERSDAFESLGIAQFYNGNYGEAISNLEAAIAPRYIKVKSKRRVAVIKTLVNSSMIKPLLEYIIFFLMTILISVVGFAVLPFW